MGVLEEYGERAFADELVAHSQKYAPQLCNVAGEANVRRTVQDGVKAAREYGFTLRGPLRFYIEMMLTFGSRFDTDPQLPWAGESLRNREFRDELLWAEHIFERMREYCETVMGPQDEHAVEALRKAAAASPNDLQKYPGDFTRKLDAMLTDGFPQKRQYMGETGFRQLLARAREEAGRFEMGSESQQSFIAVLLFSFGHGVMDDLMFPWVVSTLRDPLVVRVEDRIERLQRKVRLYAERALQNHEAEAGA